MRTLSRANFDRERTHNILKEITKMGRAGEERLPCINSYANSIPKGGENLDG